ncbi:EF-P beta-lysylation protein EpmB [Acinetobacter rathckeae]|uniref:EF-P beta-lysylation protein EpmB n=1 Tax=Acinetobacter rathckeae TaxID=2605272 RepID=UPI0018A29E7C|nr:EF-P beta-lysylation protein EpmB [Acinetobacter rathckeae]MBF7687482.1 EF-P beta-lysylation protein EpmB [Acinetobacter rathckeae]MBF7694883.1 EF-P beta-lysylation protein EpmB [Acinetobacter rathckeae]
MINYLYREQNWKSQLNDLITDPHELLDLLSLSPDELLSGAILASQQFKLRVPRSFVEKMSQENPLDPLLLQVLPHHLELDEHDGFVTDPLGEEAATQLPGVLHKYESRFLLTLTGACAIHCRYCFRRHFPYQENLPKNKDWLEIKKYIESQPQINEVILSGGDPLTLSNQKLHTWLERIASLPQIKFLRIHSRVPIVIPERLDEELIHTLATSRLKIILVIHANHANEIDHTTQHYLKQLQQHQVTLLNQSVLLKGVNDTAKTLQDLSYRLFESGVMPYYLHVLDKVKGAQHFDLSQDHVTTLYNELLAQLPGYLVPKLVREIAGEKNKTPIVTQFNHIG